MSLQIWLPLRGNLVNYGVSGLQTASVQSGVAVSNDGKIGQCYKNSGTTANVTTTINLTVVAFSICSWVRIDTLQSNWTRSWGFIGSDSAYIGLGCEHSNGTSLGFHYYKTYSGTNTKIFDNYPCAPEVGTWVHYTMTYDGTKYCIYKNGALLVSANADKTNVQTTLTGLKMFGGNGSYSAKHSLNDVRFYDHCLSPKEVKEISKGLTIHYPLDCNGLGVPNLCDNSVTFTGWSAASGWTKGVSDDGSIMYSFSRTGATSNNWVRLIPTVKVNGNNYPNGITVSMDLLTPDKSAINQKCLGSIQTYQSNNSRIGWAEPGWNLDSVVNNKWSRVSYSFTQSNLLVNNTSGTTYDYTQFSFQLVQNGNISIRKIMIAEGNKAQPYTLSVNDTGMAQNDTSGFRYNGTRVNTTTDIDTVRYRSSTKFPANNAYVTIANCFMTNQLLTELTICVWFKTNTLNSTAPNWFSLGQNSFIRARIASATSVWAYYNVNGTMKSSTYTTKTLTDNVWHHYAITFKSGVERVYIDGAQVGTTDSSSTGTVLKVGAVTWNLAGYTESAEKFIGSESDFRIYATALSADDIKELYQVSASLDSRGNVLGYEFSE